jgi:hypothetical protein
VVLTRFETGDSNGIETSCDDWADVEIYGTVETASDTSVVTTDGGKGMEAELDAEVWYHVDLELERVELVWFEDATGGSVSRDALFTIIAEEEAEGNV